MSASTISKRAKGWATKVNRSRHPLWIITVLSFLETIIIPVPIEVVLMRHSLATALGATAIITLLLLGGQHLAGQIV